MRILAVTNIYPTRQHPALGIFVEQQIQGLRQLGHEVEVVFLNRMEKGVSAYRGLRREIGARVAAFKPDVVHVMYGGVMASLVTRVVTLTPIVVTFHGSDLLGEHLSGVLRKVISGYGIYASWNAARRAKGIVVVSRLLQDSLPDDIDRSKVRIIPCGIDLDRFRPLDRHQCRDKLGWDANDFHILFNGNSEDPVKRPLLARDTVVALIRMGSHATLHELRGVPNQDVPVWLNACDVILLTSRHEGSPTIIKEALACNVPVVSVDVGDVREQIQGLAGCYLALPDPDDLAAKLALVCSGPSRIEGRLRMQELSLENVARRLVAFYGEVLDSAEERRAH